MQEVLAVLVLAAFAYFIGKELLYRRRHKDFLDSRDARGRPMVRTPKPPKPPKPAKPEQRVSDKELKERAKVLKAAVKRGDLPLDEAASSLVRFAGIDEPRARKLLS